jgi:hypothetical protein
MIGMLIRVLGLITALFVSPAPGAVCPEVNAEPTEGGSVIRIRHKESHPLTAFLVEIVDYPGNHFTYMEDSLVRGKTAANAEKQVLVQSLMPGTVPEYLKVTSAVYEDGSTCGAVEKLKVLVDARRSELAFTRELIARIEKGLSDGVAPAELANGVAEFGRSRPRSSSAVVSDVADELKRRPAAEILAGLRAVEKILVTSKPSL